MNDERPNSRIPDFASREEEAAWFDTHDIGDYLDEFEVIDPKDVVVQLGRKASGDSRLRSDDAEADDA